MVIAAAAVMADGCDDYCKERNCNGRASGGERGNAACDAAGWMEYAKFEQVDVSACSETAQ